MTRRGRGRAETSAGGVVVRHGPGGPLVLLIRDSYGKWGFPKGHVEAGEHADHAALRETAEETGLRDLRLVSPLETISWYFQWQGSLVHKTCHYFLMESPGGDTAPQAAEGITACAWETFDSAESLIPYRNARSVLRRARELADAMRVNP
jgi:8-oxo-dGTP pyrophosphatase MutT (NUDIX family)